MVQVYGSGVAVTWGAVPSSWARFDVVVGFGGVWSSRSQIDHCGLGCCVFM